MQALEVASMFLNQPRQELLTGRTALASCVKDGWHHTIKERSAAGAVPYSLRLAASWAQRCVWTS
eukprot:4065466-Amphidinium_carterae.1